MAGLLSVIISSEKRRNLLLFLKEGPRTWDQIKNELKVTATGMLPQIHILEKEDLVVREGRMCSLTDTGKLVAHHLEPFDRTIRVISQQRKFWREHDITAFPHEFFIRLGELQNLQILEAGVEESFEPHAQFLERIFHSERVAGVSPIVHPLYPKFFLSRAEEGRDIRLILTKRAFSRIRKDYQDMLLQGLEYRNAGLSVCEDDIRFANIVTDTHITMGFFLKNGIFDSSREVVSTEPSAIRWGMDLFSYYLNHSRPVSREGSY